MDKKVTSKILKTANIIHTSSLKGGGNFMFTNSEFIKMWHEEKLKIEKLEKRKQIINKILKK
jgi:hypothetical protein